VRPRILVSLLVLAALAAACSSSSKSSANKNTSTPSFAPAITHYPNDGALRLDQVQVLGSHNSYHGRPFPPVLADLYKVLPATAATLDYSHEPLPKQFDIGVRQIELDVWDDPNGGKYAHPTLPASLGVPPPDPAIMGKPGYKIIHQADVDTNSTCLTFVLCLQQVKAWSDAHPGHVAMDVHIEMKDPSVTEDMFQRLEHEITSVFRRNDIVNPDDVRGSSATLGEAVRTHGWPTLGVTRGKVYFTLDNESFRDAYLRGHPSLRGRLIFTPSSPGQDDAAYAKLNDPVQDAKKIAAALAAHMIVRTRADADTVQARNNDPSQREAALKGGAQLVSTDYEFPDPKFGPYEVRIPGGMPARCDPVDVPAAPCTPLDVENPKYLTAR